MEPATVSAIIGGAREHWQASEDIEITLEANPNSVEADRFADLAAAGVNRLSLGLQSFDDTALAFLGRAHSADEGQRALDIAQKHFPRVSFDLIYALPGDTETGWAKTLDCALAKGTSHLSLYQLTIEPGTRFASMVAKHEFEPLDGDEAAGLYELTAGAARPPPASPHTKSATTRAWDRKAATTSPTGATATMPASDPERTDGGSASARFGIASPRTSCPG